MALFGSMRTWEFLSKLDSKRIIEAIQQAEAKTSGEIRVFVKRGPLPGDALVAARKNFHELGMEKTKQRNGVLIFVAPRARKFAVIGDEGVHQKCDEKYWQRLVDSMSYAFPEGKFYRCIARSGPADRRITGQTFSETRRRYERIAGRGRGNLTRGE